MLSALGRKEEALVDLAKADSLQSEDKEMLIRDAITLAELGEDVRGGALLKKALNLGYPRKKAEELTQLANVLKTIK